MTVGLPSSRINRFHHYFWQVMDWIYPPHCAGCSSPGNRFCQTCLSLVKVIDQDKVCPRCGIPQSTVELCQECAVGEPEFTAVRSWGLYEGPIRKAIHRLKYQNDLGVSEDLAKPLSLLLEDLNWHIDLVLPVPLSRMRMRSRGYNQSAMLARWIAGARGVPYNAACLTRSKDTISQVGLSGEERRRNVLGAFEAVPDLAAGKSLLVIDDVTTTGATMQACAKALILAGARQVYGLTLARAGQIHLS